MMQHNATEHPRGWRHRVMRMDATTHLVHRVARAQGNPMVDGGAQHRRKAMMTQLQTWGVAVAIGASLVAGGPAWAATDAVKIDAFSDGRGIDTNALHAIRQTVGSAIAASIVDTFVVLSPQRGGPIPLEGGLSACAERGFGATEQQFVAFVTRLDAIAPQPGTTITVTRVASCTDDPPPLQPCGGITGFPCPKGQFCVDDPRDECDPAKGGADCSGFCVDDAVVCPQDVRACPDGSFVGRVPPSCVFAPCPSR